MKADVTLDSWTIVGVEGKDIEEIKDKVAYDQNLSFYGRSLLVVKIREENYINESKVETEILQEKIKEINVKIKKINNDIEAKQFGDIFK